MPLVEIHLIKGKPPQYIKAIADGVHQALEVIWGIPSNARFQLIQEYEEGHFYMDKEFWKIACFKDKAVIISVGTVERPLETKKLFYEELIRILEKNPGIRKENLFIQLVPNSEENWWL